MKNRLAKSIFRVLLLLMVSTLAIAGTHSFAAEERTQGEGVRELVLLNWSEYIDPSLISDFESKFNAMVKMEYFDSEEGRDQLLNDNRARGFDVIVMDQPTLQRYAEREWIVPVGLTEIPNLQFSDPDWLEENADGKVLGVPYHWGTLGIAYRTDLVPEPITRWSEFFQPRDEFKGQILVHKDSWDVVGMALLSLGFSANSVDPLEISAAEQLLLKQKPFVRSYISNVPLTEDSPLVKGDIAVAMMFNGDALTLMDFHESIEYILPEEGGFLWCDYLCVAKHSTQKEMAKDFVNFLNEPENAKRNAEYLYYAPANLAAFKLLSPEYLEDTDIFPTEKQLNKCETFGPMTPHGVKQRLIISARLGILTDPTNSSSSANN